MLGKEGSGEAARRQSLLPIQRRKLWEEMERIHSPDYPEWLPKRWALHFSTLVLVSKPKAVWCRPGNLFFPEYLSLLGAHVPCV